MAVDIQDVIREVRDYVQDTQEPYRYSDPDMLMYVNNGLKQMAVLRPDLFTKEVEIELEADSPVRIKLPPPDTDDDDQRRIVRIMELESAGPTPGEGEEYMPRTAPVEVMKTDMDRCAPGWRFVDPDKNPRGICRQWMRDPRVPQEFLVYPPPAAQTIRAIYAVEPMTVAANTVLPDLPDVYQSALVACCIYLASSVDAEHVESGRAERFRNAFREGMGASVESRLVTDRPDAAENVIEAGARR